MNRDRIGLNPFRDESSRKSSTRFDDEAKSPKNAIPRCQFAYPPTEKVQPGLKLFNEAQTDKVQVTRMVNPAKKLNEQT